MSGFFTKKETESQSRPDGKVYSCVSCGLHQSVKSPRMQPYGNFKKKILVMGECPGEVEDQKGMPWQGRTGRLLERTLKTLGVDLFEDCLSTNSCHCRPMDERGNNRPPTNYEIDSCRQVNLKLIKEQRPHVILLLGGSAVYSIIGHRWKKSLEGISKWRGWTIPDRDLQAWLCPTFHPSYVERSDHGAEETIWINDLQQALNKLDDPLPTYTEPEVEIITDLSPLKKIRKHISFDYETTGLKPHRAGHRVVCCAVADTYDHAYAFMMPPSPAAREPFLQLLRNHHIAKQAHNMKFEDRWSAVRLRTTVQGWMWDTMLSAHLLDNRPGVTGLKFQTYVHFGVVDYSSEISPYLQSVEDKDANAMNRIMELVQSSEGRKKLLHYCGLDAVYEYRLSALHHSIIVTPFLKA